MLFLTICMLSVIISYENVQINKYCLFSAFYPLICFFIEYIADNYTKNVHFRIIVETNTKL